MTAMHPKAMLADLLDHPTFAAIRERHVADALSLGIGNGPPVLYAVGTTDVYLTRGNVPDAPDFWERVAAIAAATEQSLAPLRVWTAQIIASHASDERGIRALSMPPLHTALDAFLRFAWEDADRRAGSDDYTFVDFEFCYDAPQGARTTRLNAFGGPSVGGKEVRIDPASRAALDLADWVAAAWSWLDGFERLRVSHKPDRPSGHQAMRAATPPDGGRTPPFGFIIRSDNGLRIEPKPPLA